MAQSIHDVRRLIEILRDGESFYRQARDRVRSVEHRALFQELAERKLKMINDVESALAMSERASAEQPWIVEVRACYEKSRAALDTDKDAAFIGELEAAEDRLLKGFRRAMRVDAPELRRALGKHYAQAVETHERMRRVRRTHRF